LKINGFLAIPIFGMLGMHII